MTEWHPESIQHLELRNVGLSMFHVGTLRNLVALDLSDNAITSIAKCGLERLDKLRGLNLARNQLDKECFTVLPYVFFVYCRVAWTRADLVAMFVWV